MGKRRRQEQHQDEHREPRERYEKTRTTLIQARGQHQIEYFEAMRNNDVVFAIGPAGTGKTLLPTAFGIQSLLQGFYDKLIITRPVVEAGESLGYLPGTLNEKLDPYVRPVFDFLVKQVGPVRMKKMLDDGTVEIAPLAFMRGRTFERCFILLDEAQNTSPSQMLMFLTRLGADSKMVITGDPDQIDIRGQSGLAWAVPRLREIPSIGTVIFDEGDVVRHPLIGPIIQALR